jgi:tetratricopeptide (TPR) repeat protein
MLGVVWYYLGDYARAMTLWVETLQICRQTGFKPVLAQVAGNLGKVYRALGRHAEALDYRQEGLEVARAIGFRTFQPDGLLDIGMIHSDQGRHQVAISFVEEALAVAQDVGYRPLVVQATNALARIRLRMGGREQAHQALDLAQQALSEARQAGLRHAEIMALSLQGRALLALGDADRACGASRAAVELLEIHGVPEGDERSVYYHHAQSLVALGKDAEAAKHLLLAKTRMDAMAAGIAVAELRGSFLRNVPINRAIQQACQEIKANG